jgi:hypothetical protein
MRLSRPNTKKEQMHTIWHSKEMATADSEVIGSNNYRLHP